MAVFRADSAIQWHNKLRAGQKIRKIKSKKQKWKTKMFALSETENRRHEFSPSIHEGKLNAK